MDAKQDYEYASSRRILGFELMASELRASSSFNWICFTALHPKPETLSQPIPRISHCAPCCGIWSYPTLSCPYGLGFRVQGLGFRVRV